MRQLRYSPFRRLFAKRFADVESDQPGPGLAALGALLDRSLVQVEDAAVDARRFDRQTIYSVTNVWDNNTFPLFRAATARTPEKREQRALAALEWMAGFGAQRRAWMVEQARVAGRELDPLLPAAKPYVPGRDYRGCVMPSLVPVTSEAAAVLAADYDLASAVVRSLRMEREGTRLNGFVQLELDRAYHNGDEAPRAPAALELHLEDVRHVVFDSLDARGVALKTSEDGTTIGVGAHGTLRAAHVTAYPDDRSWHLSSAGREADIRTPPRDEVPRRTRPPQEEELQATAQAAAALVKFAMLEMRMVRYPQYAGRVPIQDFCRAFAGAGEAILLAGTQRTPSRREAAFRELIETWVQRGGPRLARWFSSHGAHPGGADVRGSAHIVAERQAPARTPLSVAELRMASYTAAHTDYGSDRAASGHFHLAAPGSGGGPWGLHALHCTEPHRFRLRTEAFHGADRPQTSVGEGTTRIVALHDGAFEVSGDDTWDVEPGRVDGLAAARPSCVERQ